LVKFIFIFGADLLITMQNEDIADLKRALLNSGYSMGLIEKIITYYLHSDLN
jgi:hypothetical protein